MSCPRRTSLVLALALLAGCAELTEPTLDESERQRPAQPQAAAKPAPRAPRPSPSARPQPAAQQPPDNESVEAAHILVAHKDARRSKVDRSKDEAQKLAAQIAAKAKKGDDFAKLANQYSDDPGSKPRGGSLGRFTRRRMVKPFADAAFALKPGEVSGVVETPFGFHVIKRTK